MKTNRELFFVGAALRVMCVAMLCFNHGAEAEPSPPDVLDFVVADAAAPAGVVLLDAVVKPAVDGTAELEISESGGARLASGERTKKFTLRKGDAHSRERVQVNVADGKPRTVKATLRLLGADGKPWLIVERVVKLNQPQAEAGEPRVPVVQTLPDGTRVVEYITRQQALARGLHATGKPAPSTPRPPDGGVEEK